jgi:hypothetical protein
MRMRTVARRLVFVAAPLLVGGTSALMPAAGAAARNVRAESARSFAPHGVLNDVAAISARSAWAVGRTGLCRPATLIARWNGAAWKVASAPASARAGWLNDVAVASARDAWAVGWSGGFNTPQRPLILHWNGIAWTRTTGLTGSSVLAGIAATSARNAWAVGFTSSDQALILHWNGSTWVRMTSHKPVDALLFGVGATSARNAWAVGATSAGKTLILHWNGATWTRVPSPSLAGFNDLQRVAATSARNAWAVGYTADGKALILHWNGARWTRMPSPVPGAQLAEVTATSAHSAWAVGATSGLNGTFACGGDSPAAYTTGRLVGTEPGSVAADPKTVILHWNGSRWRQETSPSPADSVLLGVVATSARDAWAVGATGGLFAPGARALVLRWNGHAWQ